MGLNAFLRLCSRIAKPLVTWSVKGGVRDAQVKMVSPGNIIFSILPLFPLELVSVLYSYTGSDKRALPTYQREKSAPPMKPKGGKNLCVYGLVSGTCKHGKGCVDRHM